MSNSTKRLKRNGRAPQAKWADVLTSIYKFLGRFVAYPSDHAQRAHTLWIAHTHAMELWYSTPRIAFLSPEPSSGKTRALEVSEVLVPRPVEAINATPAYLFRKVSDPDGLPTILFDEIDTLFGAKAREHEEVRAILNAGHRRGATAGRCVVKGKQIETEELPAFCAVALAGLGHLPDTILSRSVVIAMRRRAPTEHVEPWRRREVLQEGDSLRGRLAEFASAMCATHVEWPTMPANVTDRDADVWEALLVCADAAGGEWSEKAREAACALVADAKRNPVSLGLRLLTDIRLIFKDRDYAEGMRTVDLIPALLALEDAPWSSLRRGPLEASYLAKLLRPYQIQPEQIRFGDGQARGYKHAPLNDAWARYLPPLEAVTAVTPVTTVTPVTGVTAFEGQEDLDEWGYR
jgi:Protein of unknown function (DUF3631)